MSDELNTAYKIAAGACIMAFLLSIGLSLLLIGRSVWNHTAAQLTAPITAIQDNDAFFLASYEKPAPVADIWKLVSRINFGANTGSTNGNITTFTIKEQNPANPNDWVLVSTNVKDLDKYMARKAYMSWSLNKRTGLYTVEVSLTR